MKLLVTGAAGFIGSNLTEELVRRGGQVRALDNLSTGRLSNIEHLLPEIEFINGDIRDAAACNFAFAKTNANAKKSVHGR